MERDICEKSEDLLLLYNWCIPVPCHLALTSKHYFCLFLLMILCKLTTDASLKPSDNYVPHKKMNWGHILCWTLKDLIFLKIRDYMMMDLEGLLEGMENNLSFCRYAKWSILGQLVTYDKQCGQFFLNYDLENDRILDPIFRKCSCCKE